MAVIEVKLENFGKVLREHTDKHITEVRAGVARGLARSIPMLVQSSPVDTGHYASSWDFTITEKAAILGNFAPHAAIIERGARPFTPPLPPLLAWAKRVLQDPSQPPDYSDEVWGLAVGTQKKIQREGMAPKHILENNLPGIIENIRMELESG